jgi:hypothetical protein
MRSSSIARLSQKTNAARQAAVEIFPRNDPIAALLGEEVEPFVEFCHVDQRAVFGEKIPDRGAVGLHRTAPSGSMPNSSA